MSVICGGSMPPQTAKFTLLNKNFMTATRRAILKLYSTRNLELSNLLDLDHIYCGTSILPVRDWQLLRCLSNQKDVFFVLDDSRAG